MELQIDLISWSFGAGVFAFFNPCGFAMLPAYVSYYLGRAEEDAHGGWRLLLRGLTLGGVVSAGFLTVFSALGVIISFIGGAIGAAIPWVGAAIGFGLVVLGLTMLFGNVSLSLPALERLAGRISQARGNSSRRGLSFYYFYGITYALASTGCTLPLFLIVVGTAFAGGVLNGVVQFGAYSLGMTLMMLGLSIVMVLSKELVAKAIPVLMRAMRWIGAVGVLAAGLYLLWYNLIYSGLIPL